MWGSASVESLKNSLVNHTGSFTVPVKKADVRVFEQGVERDIEEESGSKHSILGGKKDNIVRLVLDTNVFIHGVNMDNFGADAEYYTIEEVVDELKDDTSRSRFDNFPYPIKIVKINDACLRQINKASIATGDFCVLSLPDRKVMALAYQLEQECNGSKYLKTEIQSPVSFIVQTRVDDKEDVEEEEVVEEENEVKEVATGKFVGFTARDFVLGDFLTMQQEAYNAQYTCDAIDLLITDEAIQAAQLDGSYTVTVAKKKQGGLLGFDDGQWITPDNVQSISSKSVTVGQSSASVATATKPSAGDALLPMPVVDTSRAAMQLSDGSQVACITTDFAMQNVLLQSGVRVLASNGMLVQKLVQYVMGCHGCYTLSRDMGRAFCASCGGHTMVRVGVNVNKKGVVSYSWPLRKIYNTRGTIYAIPKVKGGKKNKDLIFREDMLPKPKLRDIKAAKEAAVADIFEQGAEFAFNYVAPRSDAVVGYGKRNPNAVRKHKK